MIKLKNFIKKIIQSSDDKFYYKIPSKALADTEFVLREYGNLNPPHEGIVYWAGSMERGIFHILAVIAPKTISNSGKVLIPPRGNFDFVRILNKNRLIHIAQVHSHPTAWVGHSPGDDSWAAFKKEGLLSIVVPSYGLKGFGGLENCGCHRFQNNSFTCLSRDYVLNHFQIVKNIPSQFVDLRK